jgi:hypothetical protein
MIVERAARRNPGPLGPGQASYLLRRGKELAADNDHIHAVTNEGFILKLMMLLTAFALSFVTFRW